MQICKSVETIRSTVRNFRNENKLIGFVPTMGFLHEGHLSLVRKAHEQAESVIVSIFVNPTQFENPADLEAYPRNTERDLELLQAAGVDAVFLPDPAQIYAEGAETIVETTRLANAWHGQVRPGHFRGVATVVTKLFHIVQPDIAVFGEKDYQQLQVIRRMVGDLFLPINILGGPTVREADGLALSSRNVRLSPQDRIAALVLNRSLDLAERLAAEGTTVQALQQAVTDFIGQEPRAHDINVDICAAETMKPLAGAVISPVALMISARFGEVLLIDQRVVTPE